MSIDDAARTIPATLVVDEARRRRVRPWAIVGAIVVGLATGGVTLSYTPVFGAREVEVEGTAHLSPHQVLRTAGVGEGVNVAHLDERSIEARLEMHPWIQDATVQTSMPATITISVTERSPLTVADLGHGLRLIAADGTDLGRAPWPSSLPEVSTSGGAPASSGVLRAAGRLIRALPLDLRSEVDSVVVAADASAALVLDGGVDVRYGPIEEWTAKSQALRAILAYADRERRGLVSIDISAPTAPTARFVGAPTPVSMPDPSADVVADDDRTGPVDPSV
jgi:cell division protein FtsQ